ncbi:hypothetical protein HUK80_06185 [Flavobacterium sp. MAH-1]|uniref:Uncharacterized protein n=1 Tax=Flavobacterium agri TaxID=2743471 RepID=A0A7Y9C6M1_9FLAO|nr:hypothetical protein [Flavobacterium agri]NUY80478.1 hypothetical protein [Flavobacterium agri]NYA70503.1 hypothetical protein [Flavobacterium agri]
MSSKHKTIGEIFDDAGMVFPTTPKAIEEFKKHHNVEDECPLNFENPIDIIMGGRKELKSHTPINLFIPNDGVQNLAMAARQGKSIPLDIKAKMIEDKKNAQQK